MGGDLPGALGTNVVDIPGEATAVNGENDPARPVGTESAGKTADESIAAAAASKPTEGGEVKKKSKELKKKPEAVNFAILRAIETTHRSIPGIMTHSAVPSATATSIAVPTMPAREVTIPTAEEAQANKLAADVFSPLPRGSDKQQRSTHITSSGEGGGIKRLYKEETGNGIGSGSVTGGSPVVKQARVGGV